MKKIYYIAISLVFFFSIGYTSNNTTLISPLNECETKALNLAIELLEKLSENTPFSRVDGQKFFGDIENFYGYTLSFYKKNNFVSIKSEKSKSVEIIPIKKLPSLSFFGETLRMYRNIFISESSSAIFSVERQYYLNREKKITCFDKDIVVISIKPDVNTPIRISLIYSIPHGFFLEDVYINGVPLFVYTKLAPTENPMQVSSEFLDLMKKHLLSLQK